MNAGKTTTASQLVHSLSTAGFRVAAGKLTGTACRKDLNSMDDAGAVAVLDLVESYREMTNGLMEVYLMQANNRMSEVMKTMAVITVFFLPLTFLTGLYGMNFDRDRGNMPELGWQYGYLWFWCWVALVVGGIFVWVKRKRWL